MTDELIFYFANEFPQYAFLLFAMGGAMWVFYKIQRATLDTSVMQSKIVAKEVAHEIIKSFDNRFMQNNRDILNHIKHLDEKMVEQLTEMRKIQEKITEIQIENSKK